MKKVFIPLSSNTGGEKVTEFEKSFLLNVSAYRQLVEG